MISASGNAQSVLLITTSGVKWSSLSMATAPSPVGQDQPSKATAPIVFDVSQPPVIEGFTPLTRALREESFKDKFIRKTKENPFVPIGELHKTISYTSCRLDNTRTLKINQFPYETLLNIICVYINVSIFKGYIIETFYM